MKFTKTDLPGVLIIEPNVLGDSRGWFMETFSKRELFTEGYTGEFIQDNHSYSATQGVLRGLHFQNSPKAQSKLIRCTKGGILDFVVDLRKNSETFCKWISIELTAENKKQLLIPKGFGHGFLTLTPDIEVQYKVDEYYSATEDRSIRYDDPDIGIDWGIANPVLSQKDINAPFLKDSDCNFGYKVLVTGVKGQLGYDLIKRLNILGVECKGVDIEDFDLTDAKATLDYCKEYSPDIIVHCAAYTAVDKAEDDQDKCYAVNVAGTANIAVAARTLDSKLVYISTDYIFDGQGDKPFEIDDTPVPINYYGRTKFEGEQKVREITEKYFILRTAWVFGKNGNNFIKTMLRIGKEHGAVKVINDQFGSPTYTEDLAILICDMIFTNKFGTYHATNEGFCSWYDFACEIFKAADMNVSVTPISTSDYPTRAKRPGNSRLAKTKLTLEGFNKMPEWQNAVIRYIREENECK
jgi:dTDP-4-dehydrorhamnose reductase/dTDP-4-dehydrorhamnose 3,5-epimerase